MRILILLILPFIHISQAIAFDQQTLLKVFFTIVQVHTSNHDDSGEGLGSGVVVSENKVLTNCHVLRKANSTWISQGEDSFGVTGSQIDARHDLCLLTTKDMPIKPAQIGSVNDLKAGMEVFAIGHSSGIIAPTTSRGRIKALYPYDGSQVIRSSARFSMGASGSGLFDDQGRLVGINSFKTLGRIAYFYAMPADWIERLKILPIEPVAPFSKTAFWEDGINSPFFLQVAMPELSGKWAELLQISHQWVTTEPENAEAWYELGLSQEGIGNQEAARQSYLKTSTLNPHHGEALFRLGMLASKRGDRAEMYKISVALTGVNSEMAEDFNKAVGCIAVC